MSENETMSQKLVTRLSLQLSEKGYTLIVAGEGGDSWGGDDFLHLEVRGVARTRVTQVIQILASHDFPIVGMSVDMDDVMDELMDTYQINVTIAID